MEEIKEFKIGDYVRTKQGDIIKIEQFIRLKNIYSIVGEDGVLYGNPYKIVKKHSENITDLIEIRRCIKN